ISCTSLSEDFSECSFTIGVRLEQWPERDSTFVGLAGNQARLWNLRGRGQSSAALVNTDQIDAQHAPLPTAEIDAAPLNITPQKHTRLNVRTVPVKPRQSDCTSHR